jgi:integrase
MAKVLTDAAVRRYKAQSKRREIADARRAGLYLVIQPTGAKSWAFRFRNHGKSCKLTLGGFDETAREPVKKPVIGADLTLAEARKLAAEIDHERAGGTDVIVARKVAKIAAARKAIDDVDNAYPTLLRRYVDEHLKPNVKLWRDSARMLGLRYGQDGEGPEIVPNGLIERWAGKPVRAITPDDIFIAVDDAIRTGVPGLSRRRTARTEPLGRVMHSVLGAFFRWLMRNRCIDVNPCRAVDKPRAGKPRERVLSDAEIVAVWRGSETLAAPYAAMVKLLILTGARVREIAELPFSELSPDLTLWTLPAERAKNGREHRVPLPQLARDIIAGIPRIAGPARYVLTFTGERPVNGHSSVKRALDAASGVTGWVLHDLRRTVATGLQRLGVRLEVTEAVLNHVAGSRGGIVGVYQRHKYDDEKRAALAAWAERVAALTGGNVVELRAEGPAPSWRPEGAAQLRRQNG